MGACGYRVVSIKRQQNRLSALTRPMLMILVQCRGVAGAATEGAYSKAGSRDLRAKATTEAGLNFHFNLPLLSVAPPSPGRQTALGSRAGLCLGERAPDCKNYT